MTDRPALSAFLAALLLFTPPVALRAADAPASAEKTSAPATAPARPVDAIERAVIISVDGLRPDVLLRADAPNIRALMNDGCYTFWARTIPVAVTLPSHASMLTGVSPERHGITWNNDNEAGGYPKVPTIFERAKQAGLTTAIASGKTKFTTIAKPGTVDWASIKATRDGDVAKRANDIIELHKPQLMFIHFPGADAAGHGVGWGSKEQLKTVGEIDAAIGSVIAKLESLDLRKSTVILLSADHGGAGRQHGKDDERSRNIPWIISGPGLRKDLDLTSDRSLTIHTQDTYATICYLLGIAPGEEIEGKPVRLVVAERELLQSVGTK